MEKRSGRRIAAVAAGSWVLATTVTSLVVWRAVAVFNDGASTNILSAPQVSERLDAATASPVASSALPTPSQTPTDPPTVESATPSPDDTSATRTPTSPPPTSATRTTTRPASTAPAPAATSAVKTWTVTGGTVSVSCQGQVISLVYASPQDGWRFETESHATDRIDVNFQRVGQGTELRATCVNGVPQQTSQSTDGDR